PFWADADGRARLLEVASRGTLRNWEVRQSSGPDALERVYWISTASAAHGGEGAFIAAAREVTGTPQANRDAVEPAVEPADALTGFANREQFHFELEREIARADLFARRSRSSSSGSTTSRR